MDRYIKKYLELLKKVETDKEKADLLSKIYNDGFYDGENEG